MPDMKNLIVGNNIYTIVDNRLQTNTVNFVEAGYNSTYASYNLNIMNSNGDTISLNNLGDNTNGRRPVLTLLPNNDWKQAVQVGQLAFVSDLANKSNLLTTNTASGSASSIAAEGDASVTIAISKTGYTPLGIIGITKSGSANARVDIASFTISGTNAVVQLHNASNSAKSNIGVTVTVLYVKSS